MRCSEHLPSRSCLLPACSIATGPSSLLWPPGGQVAEELRRRVREETRLTCSCGVAPNRLLAKIASDLNKPDGQYVLAGDADAVAGFISQLPIRKVPGIGKARPADISHPQIKSLRFL